MDVINSIRARAEASWQPSLDQLAAREKAGGAYFNAFDDSVPYGVNLLIYGNLAYFATLLFLYLIMQGREEFGMKNVMRLYNLCCVCLAGTSAYAMIKGKLAQPGFVCNENLDMTEAGKLLAWGSQVFYYQKYFEFCDTFIFLLRKRYRQVSFLHVYHHSSITMIVAMYATFDTNGDCYLGVMLNSIVHVFMYSHYFVTSIGIKSTPWKPYLTQMQLIQFIIIMVQPIIAWNTGGDCGYPDWLKIVMVGYMVTMLVLFGRFYVASYLAPRPKKTQKKTE